MISQTVSQITKEAHTEFTTHNFNATIWHYPPLSAKNLNKMIGNTFKMVF